MAKKETKKVVLHLSDSTVELEGSPEELFEQIHVLMSNDKKYSDVWAQVIPFPLRGIYAHPSMQGKK